MRYLLDSFNQNNFPDFSSKFPRGVDQSEHAALGEARNVAALQASLSHDAANNSTDEAI